MHITVWKEKCDVLHLACSDQVLSQFKFMPFQTDVIFQKINKNLE